MPLLGQISLTIGTILRSNRPPLCHPTNIKGLLLMIHHSCLRRSKGNCFAVRKSATWTSSGHPAWALWTGADSTNRLSIVFGSDGSSSLPKANVDRAIGIANGGVNGEGDDYKDRFSLK